MTWWCGESMSIGAMRIGERKAIFYPKDVIVFIIKNRGW